MVIRARACVCVGERRVIDHLSFIIDVSVYHRHWPVRCGNPTVSQTQNRFYRHVDPHRPGRDTPRVLCPRDHIRTECHLLTV